MIDLFRSYQPVFDFFLFSLGLAYSQQAALRAGVFSVATAGFSALGAYACAILVKTYGAPPFLAILIGALVGGAAGWILSAPLARLRGVYQAIATLAFGEVIISLALYAEPVTGGAVGINSIPKSISTWHLLIVIAAVMYVMHAIGRSGVGRSFDALRQDETVAACLGVSITRYHALAFVISGVIGGLFGAMQSLYAYNIEPGQFGFSLMVSVLTAIVLGGRSSLIGPVFGAAILTILPELARPLAEYRPLVNGVILIGVIVFLPQGVGDAMIAYFRRRRDAARRGVSVEKRSVVASA
ncbi:branched-chain amino acid ABC transporter permease [Terrarubrum flagellatum]|uniref:branched-chain amino acid ABC transporter permease n=1 Tax=Terrirubrum flagellatum TaxID=2895980 RepID=UPI003144DEE0